MAKLEVSEFKRIMLKNQETPKDLELLISNQCVLDLLEREIDFKLIDEKTLIKKLSNDHLIEKTKMDLNLKANIAATNTIFKYITFFGVGLNGMLIGYWHGEKNASILDSPLVKYDTEGEFQLLFDSNVVESLLADYTNEDEDEYENFKNLLKKCNFEIKEIYDLDAPILNNNPNVFQPNILRNELFYEIKNSLELTKI